MSEVPTFSQPKFVNKLFLSLFSLLCVGTIQMINNTLITMRQGKRLITQKLQPIPNIIHSQVIHIILS